MNPSHLKIIKKSKRVHVKATNSVKKKCLQVENVLTNYVPAKKYTKKYVQEYKKINIVFSAKIVMKIISTIFIVNFVSKYTQTIAKMRMTINGLDVIIVKDG